MREVALISADITLAVDASNSERAINERMGNSLQCNVCCALERKCVHVASVAGAARVCDVTAL